MPKFHYSGMTLKGEVVDGELEADGKHDLIDKLKERSIFLLSFTQDAAAPPPAIPETPAGPQNSRVPLEEAASGADQAADPGRILFLGRPLTRRQLWAVGVLCVMGLSVNYANMSMRRSIHKEMQAYEGAQRVAPAPVVRTAGQPLRTRRHLLYEARVQEMQVALEPWIRPNGISAYADALSNTLVITGTEDGLARAREVLVALDRPSDLKNELDRIVEIRVHLTHYLASKAGRS